MYCDRIGSWVASWVGGLGSRGRFERGEALFLREHGISRREFERLLSYNELSRLGVVFTRLAAQEYAKIQKRYSDAAAARRKARAK